MCYFLCHMLCKRVRIMNTSCTWCTVCACIHQSTLNKRLVYEIDNNNNNCYIHQHLHNFKINIFWCIFPNSIIFFSFIARVLLISSFFFTYIVESGSSQAIRGLVVSPFRETPVPLRQEGKLGVLGFCKRHSQFLQRHPLVLRLHLVHFL